MLHRSLWLGRQSRRGGRARRGSERIGSGPDDLVRASAGRAHRTLAPPSPYRRRACAASEADSAGQPTEALDVAVVAQLAVDVARGQILVQLPLLGVREEALGTADHLRVLLLRCEAERNAERAEATHDRVLERTHKRAAAARHDRIVRACCGACALATECEHDEVARVGNHRASEVEHVVLMGLTEAIALAIVPRAAAVVEPHAPEQPLPKLRLVASRPVREQNDVSCRNARAGRHLEGVAGTGLNQACVVSLGVPLH
eukprot:7391730-Prymnesium_polylepis.1